MEKIKIYYNKTRFKNITLKKGNKVYLFIQNITTKKLNKKLNYKKIKLFKIKKSIKNIILAKNISSAKFKVNANSKLIAKPA